MNARGKSLRAAALAAVLVLAAAPAARAGGVYFVKDGDTLFRISRIFGVRAESIRELNRLDGADIKAGDRLRIPDIATESAPAVPQASGAAATAAPAAPAVAVAAAAPGDRVRTFICREEKVFHVIEQGDTLAALSRRYGTPLEQLLALNGLRRSSRLSIGQKVLVRRSGPRTHVVLRGETLRKIAARYDADVAELRRLNQLEGDRLAVGHKLLLEPCDQFAVAGSVPTAPPVSGTAASRDSGELATALAEAAAEAAVEARDRRDPATPAATPQALASVGIAGRVIDLAKTMLDIPYRFGGNTVRGIDCSAYVQRVFGLIDIDLPRTAREQFGVGERIDRDGLSVGDLVFFRTYASFPSHVGIYLGDNLFIHASSVVRKVTIDSLDQPYYTKRFLGGRRLVDDALPVTQAAADLK